MKLFEVKDIVPLDGIVKTAPLVRYNTRRDESFLEVDLSKKIQTLIGTVPKDVYCTFWSNGDWSLWELVDHLLNQTGPGTEIYLATWTISELSARKLVQWMQEGRIGKLVGVMDLRTKNRHPAAFYLAKQVFSEIKLAYCHAKVTVLVGNGEYICINGSANWTENPRLESGVIINSEVTAMANINLIKQVVENGEFGLE